MTARFALGERVRIADRAEPRHNRTPTYVRGRTGVIARICPAFGEPEVLAYGGDAAAIPLYRVRLAQREVWPDYGGATQDHLEIEVFEHWLEPVGG